MIPETQLAEWERKFEKLESPFGVGPYRDMVSELVLAVPQLIAALRETREDAQYHKECSEQAHAALGMANKDNSRLREALRPFAEAGRSHNGNFPLLPESDYRRAAAAMEGE